MCPDRYKIKQKYATFLFLLIITIGIGIFLLVNELNKNSTNPEICSQEKCERSWEEIKDYWNYSTLVSYFETPKCISMIDDVAVTSIIADNPGTTSGNIGNANVNFNQSGKHSQTITKMFNFIFHNVNI